MKGSSGYFINIRIALLECRRLLKLYGKYIIWKVHANDTCSRLIICWYKVISGTQKAYWIFEFFFFFENKYVYIDSWQRTILYLVHHSSFWDIFWRSLNSPYLLCFQRNCFIYNKSLKSLKKNTSKNCSKCRCYFWFSLLIFFSFFFF